MAINIITAFGRQPTLHLTLILAQILSSCNIVEALPATSSPILPENNDEKEEDEKKKGGVSIVFKVVLPIILIIVVVIFIYYSIKHRQNKRKHQLHNYEANVSPTDYISPPRKLKPMETINRLRQQGLFTSKVKSPGFSTTPILAEPSPHSPSSVPLTPPPKAHNLRTPKPGCRDSQTLFPESTDFPPVYVSPSHRQTTFDDIQVQPISNISSPLQSPTAFNTYKNSIGGKAPNSPPAYSDRSFSRASSTSRGTSMPPTYDHVTLDNTVDSSSTPTPTPSVRANMAAQH